MLVCFLYLYIITLYAETNNRETKREKYALNCYYVFQHISGSSFFYFLTRYRLDITIKKSSE